METLDDNIKLLSHATFIVRRSASDGIERELKRNISKVLSLLEATNDSNIEIIIQILSNFDVNVLIEQIQAGFVTEAGLQALNVIQLSYNNLQSRR